MSAALHDFPDRLSPMLVMELRQGLRGRWFTTTFLGFQGLLVVVSLLEHIARQRGAAVPQVFWGLVTAVLLLAIPLRGITALSRERRGGNLDLLRLTRLEAGRIAYGKWTALMAQSLLCAVALLPYLVLRYFSGGVETVAELLGLFWLLVLSGLLTALAVGVSGLRRLWARLSVLAMVLLLGYFLSGTSLQIVSHQFFAVPFGNAGEFRYWLWCSVATLASVACLGWGLLLFGASRVCPEASDLSSSRRAAMLLLVCLVTPLFGRAPGMMDFIPAFALVCALGFAILDALTEPPRITPVLMAPFSRSVWRRLAGRLLLPGWHTGVWFVVVLYALFLGVLFILGNPGGGSGRGGKILAIALGGLAQLFAPLLPCLLFLHRRVATNGWFAPYLTIQVISLLVPLFVIVWGSLSMPPSLFPIPFSFIITHAYGSHAPLLAVSLAWLLPTLGLAWHRSRPLFAKMREAREAYLRGEETLAVLPESEE